MNRETITQTTQRPDRHATPVALFILILAILVAIPGTRPARADSSRLSIPTRGVEERLQRLMAENTELLRELERYRAGLERAVAELNRLHSLRLPDVPVDRPRQPQGERILSVAQVRIEGRQATVSGTIRNDTLEVIHGELLLELLRDGHPAATVRLPFLASAASQTPYVHAFELEGYAAGSYSARAELNYRGGV